MSKLAKSLWQLFQRGTAGQEQESQQRPPAGVRKGLVLTDKRRTTIWLSDELVKECKHVAIDSNISFSLLVEVAIRYFLYLLKTDPETAFTILREFNPYQDQVAPQLWLPSKEVRQRKLRGG